MPRLNLNDLQDLIAGYKSDLRKLEYQVGEVKGRISDLEKDLKKKSKTAPKKRRGRPAKAASKRGAGRPRKAASDAKSTSKKRGPGRPRKAASAAKPAAKKRGPGRPRKTAK